MANSKVKLYYFDLTGRAELIRLVLTWAGKEFEDIRISRDKWPELKPSSPFGQVPFVDIDGQKFGQSLAIAQFFSREFNLHGKTNLDALRIEQFAHLMEDYFQEVAKCFREPDEVKKAELAKKVKEEVAPKYLGFATKLLEENNGKHFVGDDVTLADIILYDVVTGFLKDYTIDCVDKFPLVTALVKQIGNNDRIRAYTESLKK